METRLPPNPIRVLRESLGLTQKELAELSHVTPQRVLREEQFIYRTPSEDILGALSVESTAKGEPISTHELISDYVVNREKLHREFTEDLCTSPFYQRNVQDAINFAVDYWDALPTLRSPIMLFRQSLFAHFGLPVSAVKFSTFTGMHPGTLSDIETGKTDWNGAAALVHVLRSNLGLSDRHIQNLGSLHDQYFMRRG